jgi:4-amino-4-deoxy-L-arabinose transferase-like glycosyltransferase
MVAAGRHMFAWGYFDHPPAAWWLSAAMSALFGASDLGVRLPFIALFALTTWLMLRLGAALFGERAGLFAAVALNLSPVFSVTTGTWVLPDGPLDCALVGAALCLVHALPARDGWRWWLGAGLCGGLALLSKYTAVLVLAGAALYLLTAPEHRRWLTRPQPYAAALLAALVFSPVVVWNAHHGWASLAFQGGRASAGARLHPWGPLTVLAGEALFVLPWIWLPMMALFGRSVARGPRAWRGWLLCCLGVLPIVLFAAVAAWSGKRVLYHWAAPGYLMLFPLLGDWLARRLALGDRVVRRALLGTSVLVVALVAFATSEVRWYWLPPIAGYFTPGHDPTIEAVDWTSVRDEILARGLLKPGMILGATRWQDCGKLDYAFGGTVPVVCLTDDPREYGANGSGAGHAGADVLVVVPGGTLEGFRRQAGAGLASIIRLPSVTLGHANQAISTVTVFIARS